MQVPKEEFDRGVSFEDMTHEPFGFLSGTFKGSQRRWLTIDNEVFALVSTLKRLEDRLWNVVHICIGHKNVAFRFYSKAFVLSVARMTAQRLDQRNAILGQYVYIIVHNAGNRNCCGDLLSQWVTVPSVGVRAAAICR